MVWKGGEMTDNEKMVPESVARFKRYFEGAMAMLAGDGESPAVMTLSEERFAAIDIAKWLMDRDGMFFAPMSIVESLSGEPRRLQVAPMGSDEVVVVAESVKMKVDGLAMYVAEVGRRFPGMPDYEVMELVQRLAQS
jgi:hypothetical protein